ncbi:unnamed protein product [Protopolystoma xenopodis]|uniref:Uncharacterized protein n=1 Tax=Protopolystoma xenopodis TaxID=117903 RepID=A0A3S5B3K9_9PLAT|nr:unnamed protein product [Protopolystoma xenopodis]
MRNLDHSIIIETCFALTIERRRTTEHISSHAQASTGCRRKYTLKRAHIMSEQIYSCFLPLIPTVMGAKAHPCMQTGKCVLKSEHGRKQGFLIFPVRWTSHA